MNNNLVPSYLSSLIPSRVGDVTAYSLRNSANLRNIQCKTQLFSNSFLPSTISSWNSLPVDTRSTESLPAFKFALNKNKKSVPDLFYDGNRRLNVEHPRLRKHCSSLNEHLYSKNIVENPLFTCGEVEDTYHYLFQCPMYQNIRVSMFSALSQFQPLTLRLLLFGSLELSDEINRTIFRTVQTYIDKSNRFKRN